MNNEAIRKAAILVSALDPQTADALLEKMPAERAQLVRNAVMELAVVPDAEEEAVLSDFLRSGEPQPPAVDPGIELDDSLAEQLQRTPVEQVPLPVAEESDGAPFRFLHEATIDSLAKHLANESPQVVAVVAAHLPPKRAADLLKCFDHRAQVDILRRVAELDRGDPEVLQNLESQLRHLLDDELRVARNRSSGVAAVSAILKAAGAERNEMWGAVAQHDHELVNWLNSPVQQQVAEPHANTGLPRRTARPQPSVTVDEEMETDEGRPRLASRPRETEAPLQTPSNPVVRQRPSEPLVEAMTFGELEQLNDADLSILFGAVPKEVLLVALAGAPERFVNRLFKSLPAREAKVLQRRLAGLGPLRLADIEHAQAKLGAAAGALAAQGQIGQAGSSRFAAAA